MTPAPGLKALSTLMLLAVYWLAVPAWAADAVEVKIGAAHFPPYTVRPEQGADTGLLPQLVDALNRLQQGYHFVLVPTSIQRRFGDFQQGRTDMAIFENPQWGWEQIAHQTVDMGLEDAEVFVARQPMAATRRTSMTCAANVWHCSTAITTRSPASIPTRTTCAQPITRP